MERWKKRRKNVIFSYALKVVSQIKWFHPFLDLKNIDLDTKVEILNDLVPKLWSKAYFYKRVDNVTHLHSSQIQTAQDNLIYLKAFT